MKINVTLQIELDPENWDWADVNSPAAIRAEVKSYIFNHVSGAARLEDAAATVTLK